MFVDFHLFFVYHCCLLSLSDAGLGFGFFFVKQKTAYEMRISDWSSDVCSSDLIAEGAVKLGDEIVSDQGLLVTADEGATLRLSLGKKQIGRASCRERVCQYV